MLYWRMILFTLDKVIITRDDRLNINGASLQVREPPTLSTTYRAGASYSSGTAMAILIF